MILSLRSKNLNSKFKEISLRFNNFFLQMFNMRAFGYTAHTKQYSISCQTQTSISGSRVFKASVIRVFRSSHWRWKMRNEYQVFFIDQEKKSHGVRSGDLRDQNAGARNHYFWHVRSIRYAE